MVLPNRSPDELMRLFPFEQSEAVVVGSFCLNIYAERYGLILPDDFRAHDIDVLVTQPTFDRLRAVGWLGGEFAAAPTLRDTDSRGKHVFDVGTRANGWAYEKVAATAIEHEGILYMDPRRLLRWKSELGRKKDLAHIDFIKENVLAPWRQELSDQD